MTENEKNFKTNSIFQENEKMFRFPFHGKSKNLIDKLYIIGYDNATINKYLSDKGNNKIRIEDFDSIGTSSKNPRCKLYCSKNIQSGSKDANPALERIDSFTIPERPSIINEIVNDYNKKVLDEDTTISMIFPNKPIFYSVKESKRQLSPEKRFLKNRRNTNFYTMKSEIKNSMNTNDITEEIKEIINSKKYCMVFSSCKLLQI